MDNLTPFSHPVLAQVLAPSGGLSVVQAIVLLVVLGLVVGLIDRVQAIDPTFRLIIKAVAVVAGIMILLHTLGIF